MAAVLTEPDAAKAAAQAPGGDMTHFSMPISKWEDTGDVNPVDGTPDVEIWGKVSDGSLDSDLQIVDPDWSLAAIKTWFDTKANIRMGHDPKRPIGRGMEVDGHYVKGLIADPVAKHLIRTRVLNDWSVGIMNPDVRKGDPRFRHLDPQHKAVNGVITGRPDGLTQIGEISAVDRGSNYGTAFQLVKAAADGTPEWTGALTAPEEVLAKAAVPQVTKANGKGNGVTMTLPKNVSLSISPKDLAKLATFKQRLTTGAAATTTVPGVTKAAEPVPDEALKAVMDAEQAVYKRNIDTATRRRLASEGHALPNLSYPIENEGDLQNAAHLARTGHGDVPAAKRLIAREARERGVPNPLKGKKAKKAAKPDVAKCGCDAGMKDGKPCTSCKAGKRAAKKTAAKAAVPDVAKKKSKVMCGHCGARQNAKHVHCPECGGKLQPGAMPVTKNHEFTCLGCGKTPLDKGEQHCPQCGKENPGYLPEADSRIPANMDKAAKERVAKKRKAKKDAKGKKEPFGGSQAPAFGAKDDDGEKDEAGKCKTATPKAQKKRKGKGKGRSPAEGVKGHEGTTAPLPPHREPDGAPVEEFEKTTRLEDGDADAEMAAAMRVKAAGADRSEGVLHALTCPAFSPEVVAKAFPDATFAGLDTAAWQMKMLDAAAGSSTAGAAEAMGAFNHASALWQHAVTVKGTDPAVLHDLRVEAHKAFRDANPGPASFPTPGHPMPQSFSRPYISAGHGAASPQHDAPHHFGVPSGQIQAQDYTRGHLTEGHAADSPDNATPRHMPAPAPMTGGQPEAVHYQGTMRDNARQAMTALHDHVSRMFPDVCPMSPDPEHAQKPAPPVAAGVGGPEPHAGKTAKAAKAGKAQARKQAKAKARKAARKRRVLAAKALKGKIPLEKAQAKAGIAPPVAADKAATVEPAPASMVEPDTLKSALAEATRPLFKRLKVQDKALRKQGKVLSAIADQPDTASAPFRGVAVQKTMTSAAPAGPRNAAESAELAQTARLQMLHNEWRNSPDPSLREAAYRAMTDQLGLNQVTAPMT